MVMDIELAPAAAGLSGFTPLEDLSAPPPPRYALPSLKQGFVLKGLDTPVGLVPQVSHRLSARDRWGAARVRCGFGRSDYKVEPGLYALNHPQAGSEVLVTANYKLSFDALRSKLAGHNFWILALDTDGVNVWCAAGKRTMGTDNLVAAVKSSGLAKLLSHRRLIAPQLAGPGISAFKVKKGSGFEVFWGPVLAKDIPAFMQAGCKAQPGMRQRSFTLLERAVLVPNEIHAMLKFMLSCLPVFQILGILTTPGSWVEGLARGTLAMLWTLGGGLVGGALGPLLLPWLPGRAFALKALIPAVIYGLIILGVHGFASLTGWGLALLSLAYGSFMLMNFTGSSTYTSLSGVRREMRLAVPLQAAAALLGAVAWLFGG